MYFYLDLLSLPPYDPRLENTELLPMPKKGADQLCSNCTADQRLCLRFTDSTIPPLLIPKISRLAFFCACIGRIVSDLVGNPEDRFSRVAAHIEN